MKPVRWIGGGVLAVISFGACGEAGADNADGWAGTVDTLSNGAIRVSNPEQGLWDDGEGWRLVEELRIGSMDGEGPELFGNIIGLEVDPLGRIYVADSQAREIRVFDARGHHVRTFGGRGEEPGECEGKVHWFRTDSGDPWKSSIRRHDGRTGRALRGARTDGGAEW